MSKRGALPRDGFNPTSVVKWKPAVRNKKDAKLNPSVGKNCQTLATKVDFLDLDAIDKFMFLGLAYLEIPVVRDPEGGYGQLWSASLWGDLRAAPARDVVWWGE
jgi:hypothetical protein